MNKRTKLILVAIPSLLVSGYLALSWYFMQANIEKPIMAITTDSTPGIPRGLAKAYLWASDYDPNAVTDYGQPALSFILAGYGHEGFHNEEILQLSQQFIDKGADVNRPHISQLYKDANINELTPLLGAVLANEPVLVEHLLKNKADPNIRSKIPGKRLDNLTAIEFAEHLASLKKDDFSSVLALLKNPHDPVLVPSAPGIR